MSTSVFRCESVADFKPVLANGQRYRHPFGDKRLEARYATFSETMCNYQSIVVNQLGKSKGELAAYYRFLGNPGVTPPELIHHSLVTVGDIAFVKDILVAMDTVSIRLKWKRGVGLKKMQDSLGVVDDNKAPGLYAHCSIAIDRETQAMLGLADMALFTRPLNKLSKRGKEEARQARRKLPLESVESYVWALSSENIKGRLGGSRRVTVVMDRGSDRYEVLGRILSDGKLDAIWRSKDNRRVVEDGKPGRRLTEVLSGSAWSPSRPTPIRPLEHSSKSSGKAVQRVAREAAIRVRYASVTLARPRGPKRKTPSLTRPLYVVEAVEDASTVPEGESPISWRLLTTWEVLTDEQAWEVVRAYQSRWHIEQLFRVLKKQGLHVEETQLKSSRSVKNQIIMAISTAAKAMQLTLARDGTQHIPVDTLFNEEEQALLAKLNKGLEGKTEKQQNPHDPSGLAWAAWVIARMGGWKGYASQRPPGPITMKRGLEIFGNIIWASELLTET